MNEYQARLNQPLLKRIIALLPKDVPIYLVGGAVRDAFLNRQSYDLDFVTGGNSMRMARKLADELGVAYFPLDTERKVARLVLKPDEEISRIGVNPIRVDFSAYQGGDLAADLLGRDFTINAMAVEVHNLQSLVDPLGGVADLAMRRLRACSPSAFLDDPVRILRAIRLSVDLELRILPETLHLMREATPQLLNVSIERLRDELFRILTLLHPATALRIVDKLNALDSLLPEVGRLKDVQQSKPHLLDAWNHTFDELTRLEDLLEVIGNEFNPDKADNLAMGLVVLKLGRYRQQIVEHLFNTLNPERPHRGLLFLAALYHDVGKPETQSADEEGKISFIGHDQIGSQLVYQRGQSLRLSNLEIDRLVTIVRHHMRPSLLSHGEVKPSRKSIYRFFRDTGVAGVDICILSLADMWATYGPTLPQERWARHLDVVQAMLGAWWDEREELVFPPAVIDGRELMEAVNIESGPMVGYILEAIREAQVSHEVTDKDGAISLAKKILLENINRKTG
jgi:putative nucleotidyltransferase with HDIG domain